MQSKTQLKNISSSLLDNVVTVNLLFKRSDKVSYKFKCFKNIADTLAKNDYVIANINEKDSYFPFCVLKVLSVDDICDIDPNVNYEYKWVLSKIDTDYLDKLNKFEDDITNKLIAAQRIKAKKAICTELGIDTDFIQSLNPINLIETSTL